MELLQNGVDRAVIALWLGRDLLEQAIPERNDRLQLVWIDHNGYPLRTVGQRQDRCQAALAGLVDDYEIE